MPLQDDYQIVFFDIISMYSNIPNNLVLKSVSGRWDLICNSISIPLHEFKIAISIILKSTFFKFNKVIYEQIFDLPMGSPLSPILADIVIQDLKCNIFNTLTTYTFQFITAMLMTLLLQLQMII